MCVSSYCARDHDRHECHKIPNHAAKHTDVCHYASYYWHRPLSGKCLYQVSCRRHQEYGSLRHPLRQISLLKQFLAVSTNVCLKNQIQVCYDNVFGEHYLRLALLRVIQSYLYGSNCLLLAFACNAVALYMAGIAICSRHIHQSACRKAHCACPNTYGTWWPQLRHSCVFCDVPASLPHHLVLHTEQILRDCRLLQ